MNRDEHLAWCKQRALEYLNEGDTKGALASMLSDIRKHPDTENHAAAQLGAMLMFGGHLETVEQVRSFITGFN